VEEYLGFEIGLGTLNMGSPIVGSAVVANSNGFIVGGLSSGHEIGRVEESLGFLGR
jgi:translation initiation factor 6